MSPFKNTITSLVNGVVFEVGEIAVDTPRARYGVYFPNSFFGNEGYTIFYKDATNPFAIPVDLSEIANTQLTELLPMDQAYLVAYGVEEGYSYAHRLRLYFAAEDEDLEELRKDEQSTSLAMLKEGKEEKRAKLIAALGFDALTIHSDHIQQTHKDYADQVEEVFLQIRGNGQEVFSRIFDAIDVDEKNFEKLLNLSNDLIAQEYEHFDDSTEINNQKLMYQKEGLEKTIVHLQGLQDQYKEQLEDGKLDY